MVSNDPADHAILDEKPNDADNSNCLDWASLRRQSLEPGGFGEKRRDIWPQLLHVLPSVSLVPNSDPPPPDSIPEPSPNLTEAIAGLAPHLDERQIRLDTERSFVLYPVDGQRNNEMKLELQEQLHELLVAIFRRHPTLSYFQGYHDIITVLFLTLPRDLQLACAEKLSLHRVRDSMGATLEPVLGLLRILRNLLRLADPSYAAILERNSPLPFYALSNLLTLFSHDMPTLELVQHVFDYILCRQPIVVVYLAAAILLSRKEEVERLEREGEEGMVHSLLSGLPDLYDLEAESFPVPDSHTDREIQRDETDRDSVPAPPPAEVSSSKTEEADKEACLRGPEDEEQHSAVHESCPVPVHSHNVDQPIPEPNDDPSPSVIEIVLQDPSVDTQSETIMEPDEEKGATFSPPPSPKLKSRPKRPRQSLVMLLARADELLALHPPSHPSIALSSIMGPQSVVFTWSEDAANLPDDADAEAMVTKPELIVLPFIESEPENEDEDDSDWDVSLNDEKAKRKDRDKNDEGGKGKPRKRRKLRKRMPLVERRTVVAGAVLVLGVAMAVYGMHARTPGSFGTTGGGAIGVRELKRVGRCVRGVLAGASERIVSGLR